MDTLDVIMNEIEEVIKHIDRNQLATISQLFQKDKRIFVDGEGRSSLMAKGFAMRLMHLGFQVYVISETITPALQEKDILVSVSGSGTSSSVLYNMRRGKKMGVSNIAVTSNALNPLAKESTYVLVVPGTIKADTGNERKSVQLLSSLFDQSLHITLDALCLLISKNIQVSNTTATKAHW
jgi:6-phospho-3-hexuloisomerase